MFQIWIFLIGLIIMLMMMMKTKLGPFICMLIASLGIGLFCGLGTDATIKAVVDGFAKTCRSIGLMVIFGTILGIYLEKSKACQQIAETLLRFTGTKNASGALAATGYVVAIPVFSDVALVLLSPLVKSVARKSGKNACSLGVVTACSLLATNAFVAPTPAPLAVVAVLGLDVGTSIMWGLPAALVVTIASWAFGEFYLARKPENWFVPLENEHTNDEAEENDPSRMPSFVASMAPILLPIVLILMKSIGKFILAKGSPALVAINFLGDKNIALCIGILAAVLLLGNYLEKDKKFAPMTDALTTAGPIVFITAAGGALANIVSVTGVGTQIANALAASPIPVFLIPFLITGFSKFAQGSGSVAEIMAAGLAVPLCESGLLTPLQAFLSISAGASLGSHVNNSFTWVFSEFMGYDIKTTMKTLCFCQNVVMSLSGLAAAWVIGSLVH
jgi:gluconate transporter